MCTDFGPVSGANRNMSTFLQKLLIFPVLAKFIKIFQDTLDRHDIINISTVPWEFNIIGISDL